LFYGKDYKAMNKELNQPSIVDDVSFSVCVKDNEHSHFMDIEIV